MSVLVKQGLFYSKEHEWVRVENGTAYVGITDFAQSSLGDIVYVETPALGDALEIGAQAGVLESIKAVAELYSPVTGTVSAVNGQMETEPELLNSDPYGQFVFAVKLEGGVDELMDAAAYEEYLKTLD